VFIVKISDGCVQLTQDDSLVTVQRFSHDEPLDVQLRAVERTCEALRGALAEVVRASHRHHRTALAYEATAGFTR
jgi:signal transduction histidine kinase